MRQFERRPWQRACVWLALLVPCFLLTYSGANALAVRRHGIPSVVFAWERHIPFVPWTIVPYWSLDICYGLSVFVCATRAELDAHGRRLLTAQLLAVVCFVAFPLKFAFTRPAVHGATGLMFRALMRFDRPFNQAPSLHVALLVILWHLYARHAPWRARQALHVWFALIGLSVLTTYQHHVFDVPTGAILGGMCVWLWPDGAAATVSAADTRRAEDGFVQTIDGFVQTEGRLAETEGR